MIDFVLQVSLRADDVKLCHLLVVNIDVTFHLGFPFVLQIFFFI